MPSSKHTKAIPPEDLRAAVREVRDLLLPAGHEWEPPDWLTWTGSMWGGNQRLVSYPEDGQTWMDPDAPGWWFASRANWIMDYVRRVPRPLSLWDIGGGIGVMADLIERQGGPRVVVVEPLVASATIAANHRPRVFATTIDDIALPPRSLPAVSLFDVLEHVPQPRMLLEQIAVLLDSSSPLLVTVPAHPRLWSRIDALSGHHRRYTKGSLAKELEGAGFRIAAMRHIFTAITPLAWLSRRSGRGRSDRDVLASEQRALQPHPVVDQALRLAMAAERTLTGAIHGPVGTSLMALAFPRAASP